MRRAMPILTAAVWVLFVGPMAVPAQAKKPVPVLDRYGDPLPQGAIARLGTVRWRHTGSMMEVAFSADGKSLATLANDYSLYVWDFETGKQKLRIKKDQAEFSNLALSPDGSLLAVLAGKQHEPTALVLLEVASGKEVWRLEAAKLETGLSNYTFAPDGATLAVADAEGGGRLVKTSTGKELARWRGDSKGYSNLVFAPDGKTLATATRDGTVIREMPSGKILRQAKHLEIGPMAYSANGKLLALGSRRDGKVLLQEADSGKLIAEWESTKETWLSRLAFRDDDKVLFVILGKSPVQVWDVRTGKQIRAFGDTALGDMFSVSPDGKVLTTGRYNRIYFPRFWDTGTGKEIVRGVGHCQPIHEVQFSLDSKTITTVAYGEDTIRTWDAVAGKELTCAPLKPDRDIVALSADGTLLAVKETGADSLTLIEARTGRSKGNLRLPANTRVDALVFRLDGKELIASCERDSLRVWDVNTQKEVRHSAVTWLEGVVGWSADGKILVGYTNDLRLWEAATLRQMRKLEKLPAKEPAGGFPVLSPNGKLLTTSRGDGRVNVWEIATGGRIFTLEGGPHVAFSPDGQVVACADRQRAIRFHSLISKAELGRHEKGHELDIFAFQFSPNGNYLVTTARDTTALVWETPAAAKSRVPTLAKLSAEDLAQRLDALRSEQARIGCAALAALAGDPEKTVAALRQRLKKSPPLGVTSIAAVVAQLDDDSFEVRQQAQKTLQELGLEAGPELDNAAKGNLSAEARERVDKLLLESYERPLTGDALFSSRAVQLLEVIGSKDALKLLDELALGRASALQTQDAVEAKSRLDRR